MCICVYIQICFKKKNEKVKIVTGENEGSGGAEEAKKRRRLIAAERNHCIIIIII